MYIYINMIMLFLSAHIVQRQCVLLFSVQLNFFLLFSHTQALGHAGRFSYTTYYFLQYFIVTYSMNKLSYFLLISYFLLKFYFSTKKKVKGNTTSIYFKLPYSEINYQICLNGVYQLVLCLVRNITHYFTQKRHRSCQCWGYELLQSAQFVTNFISLRCLFFVIKNIMIPMQ